MVTLDEKIPEETEPNIRQKKKTNLTVIHLWLGMDNIESISGFEYENILVE